MTCTVPLTSGAAAVPEIVGVGIQPAGQTAVLKRQRFELFQIDVARLDVDRAGSVSPSPSASVPFTSSD